VRFALTENPVSEHRPRRAFEGLFEDFAESDFLSSDDEPNAGKKGKRN
jgi:hypothetical protein